MPRPDEGLIHAWLDGELDAAEAARVEQLVATDAEWAAAAAEARGLIAASSRILGALDVVAGDVIPHGASAAPSLAESGVTPIEAARPKATASRGRVPAWLRVAAGVVLVAGVTYGAREAMVVGGVSELGERSESTQLVVGEDFPGSVAQSRAKAAADSLAESKTDAASGFANTSEIPTTVPALSGLAPASRQGGESADAVVDPRASTQITAPAAERAAPAFAPAPAPPVASLRAPANATAAAPMSAAASASPTTAGAGERERAREDSAAATRRAASASETRALDRALERAPRDENRLSGVTVTGVQSDARAPVTAQALTPRAGSAGSAGSAAKTAPSSPASALADSLEVLEGCWRVQSQMPVDTLLRDPRVLGRDADSIRIAVTPGERYAWVRRDARGRLVGRVWRFGLTANYNAYPIDCS